MNPRSNARRGRPAVAVLAVVVLSMVAAACGGNASTGTAAGGTGGTGAPNGAQAAKPNVLTPIAVDPEPNLPATVTSADGSPVTITNVDRIVPLWGNINETLFNLGLGPNVVGRDVSATFAEAEALPVVTRSHDVSAEAVLSLNPTLVFAQPDTGPPEALDQLRAVGVPVVVLPEPKTIDDITPRIRTIAAAVGLPAEGDALASRTAKEIAEVQRTIPSSRTPPKVAFLYLRGQSGVYLMGGKGSGADSMIQAAGGIDAGTEIGLDKPFTPITSEALVQAAPDVLLLTTTGLESVGGIDELSRIPGIAQTPAGINRRVVTEEDGTLYSFGSRSPLALRALIDGLYP